jgi:hypothetical protein
MVCWRQAATPRLVAVVFVIADCRLPIQLIADCQLPICGTDEFSIDDSMGGIRPPQSAIVNWQSAI